MTSAIQAYEMFMALRHHFTTESYDFFKYNGKIKIPFKTRNTFDKRKDYHLFEKLSKKSDLMNFILANILIKPKIWIHELISFDECNKIYLEWRKRKESFSYIFEQEISLLPDDIYENGKQSSLIRIKFLPFYFSGKISLETTYVLFMMLNIYEIAFIMDDPILDEIEFKLRKYQPFMEYNFLTDESKILEIAFRKFGRKIKDEKVPF
jgi:hypothetical protein